MDQRSPTDAELVAESLAGNRDAFGQLYDRHARIVRAVVAGVSGDWPSVEDMTQESFLRAYRLLPKLRDADRFALWIVGIARHVARERRRSLRRDRHEFRPQPTDTISPIDAETEASDRDQLELVMRRLAQLPDDERLAIHVFFLEQQNARQAAELAGLSRSGFYALVQRALARLATQIRPSESIESTKT
ncbi:MAG TPA: sigma-70 family RNA polymerase sigma factor [Lacipirellulaceae bacterium]|jgi:RNA polymerase sigma-70 factor (ECF subfamily)